MARRHNPIETTVDLGLVAAIAFIAYEVIKNVSSPKADNGQPMCSYSDFQAGNCISGDGCSPCSWWEVLTATSCYKGTPSGCDSSSSSSTAAAPSGSGSSSSAPYAGGTPGGSSAPGAQPCGFMDYLRGSCCYDSATDTNYAGNPANNYSCG